MKIAFFSPLNPIQSGISDYSEELLMALHGAKVDGRAVDIDLFIDKGYRPSNGEIARRFDILPGRSFGRVVEKYDATLYQMGNSPAHAYIYGELLRHGGVVVMHEFVLHHLRVWMALNGGRRREYEEIMSRQHGEEGREAARRVMLGQFPDALFKYPLSEEVIAAAKGIIVHSLYMAELVKSVRPDVPLAVVPMGVPLPPRIPKEEARTRLGLDRDIFLITSVGHLNPYKRVSATLRAFKALLMEAPNALYLLVGSQSPNYDPARQIEMLGLSDKVKTTGYVSPQDFPYYLAASDVCINLRHPTAGETSASLLRIMGAGVPTLVSRTGSFEELPDNAVGKVDIGELEEELLLEYLLLLARRPDLRAAMSSSARHYVAQHHTLEGAALGYLQFLSAECGMQNVEISVPRIEVQSPKSKVQRSTLNVQSDNSSLVIRHSSRRPQHSALSTQHSALGLVAEAAAELGIVEGDGATLAYIAGRLDGLLPAQED